MGFVRKILNPELFQGSLGRRGYFEGWYFKLIDEGREHAAAVIPGIALGDGPHSPDSHAFVQFISSGQAEYFRYPLSDFRADKREFRVRIAGNDFSACGVTLNLGQGRIAGKLEFTDVLPFPKKLISPGVMGPFGFVPGMQCYHGLINISHRIAGNLEIDGHEVPFDGGTGYVEKDWGRGFPSAWVWVQANHFGSDAAFLFSVADIPWLGGSFRGFFAFLHLNGVMHRFASYTGARLVSLAERGGVTQAAIESRSGRLEISAVPGPGGLLKAPSNGLMNRTIEESISATVSVRLTDKNGRVLFSGASPCAGMERYAQERLFQAY
jgi:tocopherol cyclase